MTLIEKARDMANTIYKVQCQHCQRITHIGGLLDDDIRELGVLANAHSFADGSYDIPLERRLEAASQDGPSIPRLGISPTDKHMIPLTSAEGKMLLALLRKGASL